MTSKNHCNASILKWMYGISRNSFFRFSINLLKPSGFSGIKIGDTYSPISCSHFSMIP